MTSKITPRSRAPRLRTRPSLLRELQKLKMRDLRKRAASIGVAMEEVEEARDSESPKKNLIALVVARAAAAA